MKKRILSLALALVMALVLLPTAAWGADTNITVIEIVSPKYTSVQDFSEGLAAVERNGKWGFIDKTGKEVVDLQYSRVNSFSGGLAAVCLDRKWGFFDKTGAQVVPCMYEDVRNFSEGLAAVKLNGKWGFIDKTGTQVVPFEYEDAGDFSDGLATVSTGGLKWGFIDQTGKLVIPCKYSFCFVGGERPRFSEGFAVVWDENDNRGVIDKTGKLVVSFGKYAEIANFSEGLAAVRNSSWKWGFINTSGKLVISCKYSGMSMGSFYNGYAAVPLNGLFGLIDKNGNTVVPHEYGDAHSLTEGLLAVCRGNNIPVVDSNGVKSRDASWGFADTTGKEVIPCQYADAHPFSCGLAAVATGSLVSPKWGFIDTTGKVVVSFQYDEVKDFSEGLAFVKAGGKWGVITTDPNATPAGPTVLTADPTNDALKVDGVAQVPTAYKIGGANYFQLRDVAMLLNGTKGQFSVDYDAQKQAVIIVTGQPYKPLGTELSGAAQSSTEAIVGNNDVYINGEKADLEVYKIGGANYFKIRDLGKALGFNVGWTAEKGMFIESDKLYTDAD